MNKTAKIWLIIALSLVLVCCVFFVSVMATLDWSFSNLSNIKYETNNYDIDDEFYNISVKTDTAEVVFAVSDSEKCRVECYEEKKVKHSVIVKDDTLVIEDINNKHWYDYIGVNFGSPKITIYLPKSEYGSLSAYGKVGDVKLPHEFALDSVDISLSTGCVDLNASVLGAVKIKTNTGYICVEDTAVGSLELTVSTGKVTVSDVVLDGDITVGVSTGKAELNDIRCKSVVSSGSTGDIALKDVVAAEKISINRSTGDIRFTNCDAAEIFAETSTGDITGNFLTDKAFNAKTSTGKINVPNTSSGGKCEIKTGTGNIEIKIDRIY